MSARKAVGTESFHHLTIQARQTRLSLSPDSIIISRHGIEFRSATPFAEWTEMTLTLQCPEAGRVHCSGVVVCCTGSRHTGYHVSMVLTGLSKQGEARLSAMAVSQHR